MRGGSTAVYCYLHGKDATEEEARRGAVTGYGFARLKGCTVLRNNVALFLLFPRFLSLHGIRSHSERGKKMFACMRDLLRSKQPTG